MIDSARLLLDCKARVLALEADLRVRIDETPDLHAALLREHSEAVAAKRTARSFVEWERERVTQAAVAWVLGCVFVRFLEDTDLVDTPRLAGAGDRLRQAREQQTQYFRERPADTAREYLLNVFRAVAVLPGCAGLFDERTNPLFSLPLTGDAARDLVEFWRTLDSVTGDLVHDFTDPAHSTRFLGDLYQDLSEAAKKQYALLQTPEFIEEFILDRTLEPAIDEFGLAEVRLIDPACGSGHFLLGAFSRLFDHWHRREPGTDIRALAERSLGAISGVDLNPFAAEIARFRLLIAAVHACGVTHLRDAPDLRPEIGVGDALLHGTRPGRLFADAGVASATARHLYATEDASTIAAILDRRYHVVVANPPYITPNDSALNNAYRGRFSACSGKYALSVPFMQLLFDLGLRSEAGRGAGYIGQITSNSFMKREFGKKLIEDHLAHLDLSLIIDTSGAYIPGHGTPTVLLFGRNRTPIASAIRTVMGSRGEPSTPADASRGVVWTAIREQVDHPQSESDYITVEDVPRERYANHPWSIGGGGASDLRERISAASRNILGDFVTRIGFFGISGIDEIATLPLNAIRRLGSDSVFYRTIAAGGNVRDFRITCPSVVYFPYRNGSLLDITELNTIARLLWLFRSTLASRPTFSGMTYAEAGEKWHKWHQLPADTIDARPLIVFAEVATHNHFAIERREVALEQSAPVIKPNVGVSEDDLFGLIGALSSSTAEFWMRQVMQPRSGFNERWEMRLQRDGTKLGRFPLPKRRPFERARRLDSLAIELCASLPAMVEPTRPALAAARDRADALRSAMIATQEELDWEVYLAYELVDGDLTHADPPPLRLGERAFEIVLARRVATGKEQTTWFERHGSTPITELPERWPADYRELVERRIELIESDRNLGLIERPEYKRRWQWEPWEEQQERVLREWLLDRLEGPRFWGSEARLTSCARLADEVRKDADFRSVAELYAGRTDVDLGALVQELVMAEAVPYLAAWRYSDSGMRSRASWERTWELQRKEDAIDALCDLPEGDPHRLTVGQAKARKGVEVGVVTVPPKYLSKDFRSGTCWSLRGKFDVPKERFILHPGCERAADPSPVIGWAGWSHLQRAEALAQYLTRMRQEESWDAPRLTPLLAGVAELLPWVLQWHNQHDPGLGRRIGDAYHDFLRGQLNELGLADDDLGNWRPPESTRGRKKKEQPQ